MVEALSLRKNVLTVECGSWHEAHSNVLVAAEAPKIGNVLTVPILMKKGGPVAEILLCKPASDVGLVG